MRESFLKSAVVLAAVSAPGKGARTAVTVRAALEALIRLDCAPANVASALRAPVCVRCMAAVFENYNDETTRCIKASSRFEIKEC